MRHLFALGLVAVSAGVMMAAPPGTIRIDEVTYKELTAEVNAAKGRVVLVDVWGMFCGPCREKIPHVVELQKKYGKQGLLVITVSVDQAGDTEAMAGARQFLAQYRAETRNVHLKDPVALWASKWKTSSVPLMFLFDQQGRMIERYDGRVDFASMDRQIRDLLQDSQP
ncbi:TlpA family protein disulfide reductase [Zavarzinella formosa]|uniref:TlpA family protein disulfide reductase n=1 Tax=Zavarzinella formosa TaxID=360055 RepID=UPI00031B407B|nr:TlpA disulfide reductase family protein [Zavarzinella formosa]